MNNDLRHFVELLGSMTDKEMRARYKYTFIGFLWLAVNPLLQMLVIGFIFTLFMKEPVEHYYYHLFMGLLVWNFFSTSLTKATPSIVFERALIKKAAFPRSVIPLSIVLSNLINFAIAFALFLIPVGSIGTFSLTQIPIVILGLSLLSVFTIGISLLSTALNVRYRDVNFFIQAALIIWFYATPIVYSLNQMPLRLLWIWRFNPLTSVLQLLQHALLGAPMPGPAMLASNVTVTAVVIILGILVFRKESGTFDDWL